MSGTRDSVQGMQVAVLGAGTMGHGIAQVFAAAGARVHLHDVDLARIETGLAQVRTGLEKVAAKGKITAAEVERIASAIHAAPALNEILADVALIVEAVPEDMSLKAKILSECVARA